jgi:GDPmannose 4,6-dehydratase
VRTDTTFLRPAEVEHLIGDPAKARSALGWTPEVEFPALIRMMVDADLARLSRASATPAGVESR